MSKHDRFLKQEQDAMTYEWAVAVHEHEVEQCKRRIEALRRELAKERALLAYLENPNADVEP